MSAGASEFRSGVVSLDEYTEAPEGLAYGHYGARRVYNKASGKDIHRPQLELLLSFLRGGDTLVCHSMDRLGRNLDDLRKLVSI